METVDKPISILVVDDDMMFLSSLSNLLSQKFQSKVRVKPFTTGEECLHSINSDADVVILDYYLNTEKKDAMNGVEVLKKIKKEKDDATVIMLSGQDRLEVVSDSFKNGAYEYVVKNESFFARIENMVKNIIDRIDIEREKNKHEKWNYIIALLIIVLFVLDLIYYKMNQ